MDWNLQEILSRVWHSWLEGGIMMVPLALLSLVLYSTGLRLFLQLRGRSSRGFTDERLRHWVSHPQEAPSDLSEIIRYTQEDARSIEDASNRFAEIEAATVPVIDRRLATINVLVGAAPLMGLLGTVLGMLVTFRAIATGGGQMVDPMARGISEALITTEMGLLIALPGMILAFMIRRRRNEYVSLLAHVESITLRHLRTRLHGMRRPSLRRTATEERRASPNRPGTDHPGPRRPSSPVSSHSAAGARHRHEIPSIAGRS
jgi:biopolymer transport protein ExbB